MGTLQRESTPINFLPISVKKHSNQQMIALAELKELIARHAQEGKYRGHLPHLTLVSSISPGLRTTSIYEPCFALVAQGRKQTVVGSKSHEYSAGQYLIVSVDLPLTSQIITASEEEPYLAMSLALKPTIVADQLVQATHRITDVRTVTGFEVGELDSDLLDPLIRMLRLLDYPDDIPVLLPLLERELMWRLLNGTQGATVRDLTLPNSRLSQVARAIRWIRMHYAQAAKIERLAKLADMSLPSFNRHFRAITAMSPLQFQKQVRLQEARNRMLATGVDASSVSFEVGYQSPSQFNREYRRLFGSSPRKHVELLKHRSYDESSVPIGRGMLHGRTSRQRNSGLTNLP